MIIPPPPPQRILNTFSLWFKESLFPHRKRKFNKQQVWGTQKQYVYANTTYKMKNSMTLVVAMAVYFSRPFVSHSRTYTCVSCGHGPVAPDVKLMTQCRESVGYHPLLPSPPTIPTPAPYPHCLHYPLPATSWRLP